MAHLMSSLQNKKITLLTQKPVAFDSPDHIQPWGTARDNSVHLGFNQKLFWWIPKEELRVLDVGCSGGGFVKSVLDAGAFSVGVEGSDFSKRHRRAEWATIPDFLFTADATAPFEVRLCEGGKVGELIQFSVVTAWEFIEHIREEDLPAVLDNFGKHLCRGGVVIMSISPKDDIINGVQLHQCVHEREWWLAKLQSLGWVNHPAIVDFFNPDWVRSEPNAPSSFHVCLTRPGEAPIFLERIKPNASV